jgi:chromosome segregation ATPase
MYTDQDLANLPPEEKRRQRHTIQMDMVILESDLKKSISEKTNLESDIRRIKMDMERLRVDLDQRNQRFEKLAWQIQQGEDEIKRLKKKLNLL